MAFVATKPASNYTPPPEGNFIARCYRLIDLGTQQKTYQGKITGEARKIIASWEILDQNEEGNPLVMDDGKPFSISKSWFLSMHEKASLRKDLESWRGRPFTADEENSFDVSKLMGAYCMVNIINEQGEDGQTYTKIGAITPLHKSMSKPKPINNNQIFDADEPDMAMFEKFSDKMKDLIRGSREWRARASGGRPSTTAMTTPQHHADDDMDDDIPF